MSDCTHGDHVRVTELIRSLEPGETWCWCYVDELALDIPEVRGTTRIPPSPLLLAGRPQEER